MLNSVLRGRSTSQVGKSAVDDRLTAGVAREHAAIDGQRPEGDNDRRHPRHGDEHTVHESENGPDADRNRHGDGRRHVTMIGEQLGDQVRGDADGRPRRRDRCCG